MQRLNNAMVDILKGVPFPPRPDEGGSGMDHILWTRAKQHRANAMSALRKRGLVTGHDSITLTPSGERALADHLAQRSAA